MPHQTAMTDSLSHVCFAHPEPFAYDERSGHDDRTRKLRSNPPLSILAEDVRRSAQEFTSAKADLELTRRNASTFRTGSPLQAEKHQRVLVAELRTMSRPAAMACDTHLNLRR